MSRHNSNNGSGCAAIEPEAIWPFDSNMTNAQGCATMEFDQKRCAQTPECKWIAHTSHTPESYDEQIRSLEKQLKQYLEQVHIHCSRAKAFKKDTTECNEAKLHVRQITATFNAIYRDVSGDIKRIGKAITAIDKQINKLEKENTVLEGELSSALNIDAGSHGMIQDSQLLYNQQLVGNRVTIMALCIFLATVIFTGGKYVAKQATIVASKSTEAFVSYIPGMGK